MRVLLPLPAWPRRSADDHAADTSSIPPEPSDRFDSRFNLIDALAPVSQIFDAKVAPGRAGLDFPVRAV